MADVVIAGAGPAGSATALQLARSGLDVTIVERARFPRTKPCGEYLSAGAVQLLDELGVKEQLENLALRLDGIRLYGAGVRAELPLRSGAWSLPRAVLDETLLKSALAAGAKLVHGRVEGIDQSAGRVSFLVRSESGDSARVEASIAVGADGAQSILASRCGLTLPDRERRFALGGHFTDFSGLDRFVEMFVESESYFAVNPLGAGHANVMLIVPEKDLARHKDGIDRFIFDRARALSGNDRFSHAKLDGRRVAIGPLAHATRRMYADRLLLVGDAAGCVDPFTGQGVYLALLSARFAAEAVRAVFASPKTSDAALIAYDKRFSRELRARRRLSKLVRLLVRVPRLARRAARNLAYDSGRFEPLIEAVCGGPVSNAFRLSVLARLIA